MAAIDLYLACVLLLLIEYFALRRFGHPVLSPVAMIVGSVLFVYVVPYSFSNLSVMTTSRLDRERLLAGIMVTRLFIWTLVIAYGLSLPFLTRRIAAIGTSTQLQQREFLRGTPRLLLGLFVISSLVWFVFLGVGTGFHPGTMIQRALFPRQFTELRAGAGYMVYLRAITTFGLIAVASLVVVGVPGNKFLHYVLLLMAVLITVLGGSKTSLVIVVLSFVLAQQQWALRARLRDIVSGPIAGIGAKGLLVVAAVFLVLCGSFFVMDQGSVEQYGELGILGRIAEYQREAFHTANVVVDFAWNIEYVSTAVVDTAMVIVPRVFVPDKAEVGLYSKYWRPVYEPKTVYYHASTYGCLAEAHMLCGPLGPFVYAVLGCGLIVVLTTRWYAIRSALAFAHYCFLYCYTYFLVRAGFTGATFVYIVIVYIGMSIMIWGTNWMLGSFHKAERIR